MDPKLQETILNVASAVEKEIDEQIESLDSMQISDLEQLRAKKLEQMKKETEQKIKWKQMVNFTRFEEYVVIVVIF